MAEPLDRERRQRGFTLLELLVAVAVFAVVAVIAQVGLRQVMNDAGALRSAGEEQRELQLLVLLPERELGQAIARPVRTAYGEERAAVQGRADSVEYTTLAFVDGAKLAPQRHGLSLRGRELLLLRQPRLDAGPGTPRPMEVLSQAVESLRLEYIGVDGRSHNRWPPQGTENDPNRLPRAIRVQLRLQGEGEIERLLELPENPL